MHHGLCLGEFRVWHPVTKDYQIYIDLEAEKKARFEYTQNFSMSPVINKELETDITLDSKRNHTEKFDKSCGIKSKPKVQTGNFKEELKPCNICQKKFVDLQKHQKNGNCKELAKESKLKEIEQEVVCKGCSKQFKRLQVHLKSKHGAKCKELYTEFELEQEKLNKLQKSKAKILKTKREQYEAVDVFNQ